MDPKHVAPKVKCTMHKLSKCPIFNTQNISNSWHCCELTENNTNKICSTTAVESPQYLQDISQEHAQCGAVHSVVSRSSGRPVAKYDMTRVGRNDDLDLVFTKLYLNISGICSTGEVSVDLLQMTLGVTASEKVKMKSCHSWLQLSHCIFSFDQLTICNYRYLCSIKLFEIDI